MSKYLVYVWGGPYLSSVVSTEDPALIELLKQVLPKNGYRVLVRRAMDGGYRDVEDVRPKKK